MIMNGELVRIWKEAAVVPSA